MDKIELIHIALVALGAVLTYLAQKGGIVPVPGGKTVERPVVDEAAKLLKLSPEQAAVLKSWLDKLSIPAPFDDPKT